MEFNDFDDSSNRRHKRRTEQMQKIRARSINIALDINEKFEDGDKLANILASFSNKRFADEEEKPVKKFDYVTQETKEDTNVVISDLEFDGSLEEKLEEKENNHKNDTFIPLFNKLKDRVESKENLTESYMLALGLNDGHRTYTHYRFPSTKSFLNDVIEEEISVNEESYMSKESRRFDSINSLYPSTKNGQVTPKNFILSRMLSSRGDFVIRSYPFQEHVRGHSL